MLTEKMELPEDLLKLQDIINQLLSAYAVKDQYDATQRAWIRYNYGEATKKYNRISGRMCFVTNIYNVKKSDLQ